MEIYPDPYLLFDEDVIVDISMLYEVAANDEAYITLMADTFLNTVPITLENIEKGYEAEDYDNLYQAAHKVKSSLSVIKINDMLSWIKEIEQLAKQKTKDPRLHELIKKVRTRFEIAKRMLLKRFHPEHNTIA